MLDPQICFGADIELVLGLSTDGGRARAIGTLATHFLTPYFTHDALGGRTRPPCLTMYGAYTVLHGLGKHAIAAFLRRERVHQDTRLGMVR